MAVTSSHSHYRSGFSRGSLLGFCVGIMCMLLFQNIFTDIMSSSNNGAQLDSIPDGTHAPPVAADESVIGLESLLKAEEIMPTDIVTKTVQTAVQYIRPTISRQPGDVVFKPTAREAVSVDKDKSKIIADSSGSKRIRQQCSKKYGNLNFLPDNKGKLPPMLYTFPGSGNTWGRLLIEYATGVYTGSVYNDGKLLEPLPGEFTCNWKVSAVKVHPHTHAFRALNSGDFKSDNMKCRKGNVLKFKRAILLIRNPFDSIWSEFQRRVTQSHVEGWQANAAAMSNEYYSMWKDDYVGIEQTYATEDILYIRYEDLKDKNKRIKVLESVTKFLDLNAASVERLECAFILAESSQVLRQIDDSAMTKDIAYTEPLSCRMWSLFGEFAIKHDYKPWNNYNCTGYAPIIHKNVGPQGDYDERWEKPGVKLLDFGGHEHLPGIRTPNAVGIGGRGAKPRPRRPFGGFPKPTPAQLSGTPAQLYGKPAQTYGKPGPVTAQRAVTMAKPVAESLAKPLGNTAGALPAWAVDK